MKDGENSVDNVKKELESAICQLGICNLSMYDNDTGNIQSEKKFKNLLITFFPSSKTKIELCFDEHGNLKQDKRKKLQNIIFDRIYNLLSPLIQQGYEVTKVDDDVHVLLYKKKTGKYAAISIDNGSFIKSLKPTLINPIPTTLSTGKKEVRFEDPPMIFNNYKEQELQLFTYDTMEVAPLTFSKNNENDADAIQFFAELTFEEIKTAHQLIKQEIKKMEKQIISYDTKQRRTTINKDFFLKNIFPTIKQQILSNRQIPRYTFCCFNNDWFEMDNNTNKCGCFCLSDTNTNLEANLQHQP